MFNFWNKSETSVAPEPSAVSEASSEAIPILKKKDKRKSKSQKRGRKSVSIRRRPSKGGTLAKPPDPHWQSRTFGIFEKKLESPMGFYREKDKYYYLKKEYGGEPTKMKLIDEMWQYRQGYQIRKRFKWPPKNLVGRLFWTWGYYGDTLRQRHAHVLQDINGDDKIVELEDEANVDSSDDEYGRNPYYDSQDPKDWSSILRSYKVWKKNKGKGGKGGRKSIASSTGETKTKTDDALNKTATGLFRDELDNVNFDTLEAELNRRKSLGLINSPSYERLLKRRSSFHPRDKSDLPTEDEESVTTVTTEYILIKTPRKSEGGRKSNAGRKSRKSEGGKGRKSLKSRKSTTSRKSIYDEDEDDDSDYDSDEEEDSTTNVQEKRKSRKSRKSKAGGGGAKKSQSQNRGTLLPGLSMAESERLWAAYDSASGDDSSTSIQPLGAKVTTTKDVKRKSAAGRKSVKK